MNAIGFYLTLMLGLLAGSLTIAQNAPVDFEDPGFGADWTWTVFENDVNPPLEIVPNPDPTGINASATVAKFTALQAGQPFAGCETMHGADIGTFTIDASNSTIAIMVWKSVISDVGIKLVRNDNWSLGEIKIPNTVVDQWERLVFDFSAHMGNTYDQLVVFPDFNARSADQVIYFDNIFGDEVVVSPIEELDPQALHLHSNPVRDGLLSLSSSTPIEAWAIHDLLGHRVAQDKGQVAASSFAAEWLHVDVAHLPEGMYVVTVRQRGMWSSLRFVKH